MPGPDDEEPLADLFTDVFELVDKIVAQMTPVEVELAVSRALPVGRGKGGHRPSRGSLKVQQFIRSAVVTAAAGAWLAAFITAGSVQLVRFLLLVLAVLAGVVVVTTWPGSSSGSPWPRKFAERPWRDGRDVLNVALRHMREVFVVAPGRVVLAPRAVELQMNPGDLASLTSMVEIDLVNSIAEEHYQATILANAARVVTGGPVKVSVTADPTLPAGRYRLRRDQRPDIHTVDSDAEADRAHESAKKAITREFELEHHRAITGLEYILRLEAELPRQGDADSARVVPLDMPDRPGPSQSHRDRKAADSGWVIVCRPNIRLRG